jgi:hypothetical protein
VTSINSLGGAFGQTAFGTGGGPCPFDCRRRALKARPNATGEAMLDFPVVPPIVIKDTPHKRKIATLNEARALVDEMLHQRRLYKLREIKARLDGVKTEEDAVEAIGALRELLVDEDLIAG